MSHRTSRLALHLLFRRVRAFLTVNRIPETVGYNVAYFALGVGLAIDTVPTADGREHLLPLTVAFGAIMLSKMQASVADAIHDHRLDEQNPEKAYIAVAVHRIGSAQAHTVLIAELISALTLWGWLSLYVSSYLYLAVGVLVTFVGFVYSYPPRLKERGILNHFATTWVDVLCVLLPFMLLAGIPRRLTVLLALGAVFLYAFAYHVMHQAGDTFYDRQYGASTFTQTIGVPRSVLLASILTLLASVIAFGLTHVLGGIVLTAAGVGYGLLFLRIREMSEHEQSACVSRWFDIGWVAVCLNGGLAISLLL